DTSALFSSVHHTKVDCLSCCRRAPGATGFFPVSAIRFPGVLDRSWLSLTSPYFPTARPDCPLQVYLYSCTRRRSERECERGKGRGRGALLHDGYTCHPRTEDSSAKRRLLSREKAFDSSCFDQPGVPGHLQFQRRHAGCTGESPLPRSKVLFSDLSPLLSAGRLLMRGMHLSTFFSPPPSWRGQRQS
ncbi:hypothetical protein CPAR01_12982, partial [Colletotrichum paranaense]